MESNARRFIDAYNKLDKTLRVLLDLKPSYAFGDVVRRAATASPVIRKYEDDLLDFGRLRNAIVHKSDSDMVIAEPHLSVVEELEHVASIMATPPRADKTVAKKAVVFMSDMPLWKAIKIMAEQDFSNVPVMDGKTVIGVVNHKQIVEGLAKAISAGKEFNEFMQNAVIKDVLCAYHSHYSVQKSDITLDKVLTEYYKNPKLQIIVLTESGLEIGEIAGVITTGDIVAINKILENYN